MSLTPNYSFIIPTGSDAVNLLTQCYPNFTSLDSILKPIQESGVTVATDTKVGTTHQLVRTDSSCNMFRFIATGNFLTGDTFTVDGTPVTATAMDGTSLPNGAFVINQSVVCVLNNLVLTVLIAGKETSSLPASAVTYDNTVSGLTATNAQDAIDEVYASIPTVSEHGIYELWSNPNPGASFAPQTVNLTVADTSEFDSVIIVIENYTNELVAAEWKEIDFHAVSGQLYLGSFYMGVGGDIDYACRLVAVTSTATTISCAFDDGYARSRTIANVSSAT